MIIAYVGNFTQEHCTEVHLSKTLKHLGHDVLEIQEDKITPESLYKLLLELKLDLFLFTRTWGETVMINHLALLRERQIPSASYHLDLYVGLSRKYLHKDRSLGDVLQNDPFWRTDYVFTPDGDPASQEIFKANGVNHIYMRPGVYEPECYIAPIGAQQFRPEVLFVGGGATPGETNGYGHPEWPYRDQLIGWLRATYGERFTKFGHPQETVRNRELNELYGASKVVVGDSVCINFDHTYYWSDRVYETIGRGGFLIHPYIKGLEEEFTDKETIVFYEYGNFAQLEYLINYYLTHDVEREKIRRAGHEFVKKNATYTNRLTQMLDTITGAVAVPTPSTVPAIKINLGSGNDPLEGHINVDMLLRDDVDVVHNLMNFPYPFENESATHIKVIDVIEHLDHYTDDKQPTIMAFIEECYRILDVGGELYIQTPGWDSELFKIDVTHVRGFHKNSFDFFDPDTEYGKIRDFYSDAKFRVNVEELENKNLRFWMYKR